MHEPAHYFHMCAAQAFIASDCTEVYFVSGKISIHYQLVSRLLIWCILLSYNGILRKQHGEHEWCEHEWYEWEWYQWWYYVWCCGTC